ncbi:MAG: C10 family peptidase [Duncaniella sp.]|nr:C10 family peptidase [Duncaniella sp.]
MKTRFILIGLLVSMLTGCSNDDLFSLAENKSEDRLCEVVNSQNVIAIKNYIAKHHGHVSRSAENLLRPYVVDGDTVIYIANYGDGWEVFSNDPRVPMVLMKCEDGNFHPTTFDSQSPFDAFFNSTVEYLNSVKKTDFAPTDTINSEWLAYGIERLDVADDKSDSDEYHWVLVATSSPSYYHHEYTPTGGRLKTKWSQGGYFSLFTPFVGGNHAPVGCTAVAIGQYLYFTHYKDNCPEVTVTDAIYDKKNNSYRFSGSSSTVWNSFASTHRYDSIYMAPTAIFLGWVAQKIDTKFGESSSSAGFRNATLSFFNNQTRLNATPSQYSKSLMEEVLQNGYPVFIRADSEAGGHAWLIDYCETDGYTVSDYYIYVKKSSSPDSGEDIDVDGEFMENPTIENIKDFFGDVDVEIKTYSYNKSYLMGNWGWGGYCDNVKLDATIPSWSVDGYVFDDNQYIYYFK